MARTLGSVLRRHGASLFCGNVRSTACGSPAQMETVADVMTKKDLCVVGPDTSLDDGEHARAYGSSLMHSIPARFTHLRLHPSGCCAQTSRLDCM